MKILCFIDSLNSGGAQRQITNLSILLHRYGFDLSVLTYHEYDFFLKALNDEHIPVSTFSGKNKVGRLFSIFKHVKEVKPDLIIAFLKTPSMVAELCGVINRSTKVIVSERSGATDKKPLIAETIRYHLHKLADAVVVNSHNLQTHLATFAPWLDSKTHLVVNGVDLDHFKPLKDEPSDQRKLKVLTIGRICPDKNPHNFIRAVAQLMNKHQGMHLEFNWYGNNFVGDANSTQYSDYYHEAKELIERLELEGVVNLHEPVQDVVKLYQDADVFCLPSVRESCPNVIAEAMACGKPVVASRVGDIPFMVKEGENGFLFDPLSPVDIAEKLSKMVTLDSLSAVRMREKSRQFAEELFSERRFLKGFLDVISAVTGRPCPLT